MKFTIIANHLKTDAELPIIINDRLSINKATLDQVKIINRLCNERIQGLLSTSKNPFGLKKIGKNIYFEPVENIQYWILIDSNYGTIIDLEALFALLSPSLILSYNISKIEGMFSIGTPSYIYNVINNLYYDYNVININQGTFLLFNELSEKLRSMDDDPKYFFIHEGIEDFHNLLNIPNSSNLKIVGYFSIVEKLLTSRKSIALNSINHQLTNKIPLINNRSNFPIDILSDCKPTDKTTVQMVIEKLYTYRSNIAHGEQPDFKDNLQILKNSNNANNLIIELCKTIIIQTIFEPQLVLDLRNC